MPLQPVINKQIMELSFRLSAIGFALAYNMMWIFIVVVAVLHIEIAFWDNYNDEYFRPSFLLLFSFAAMFIWLIYKSHFEDNKRIMDSDSV
jgi:hypothetical protein